MDEWSHELSVRLPVRERMEFSFSLRVLELKPIKALIFITQRVTAYSLSVYKAQTTQRDAPHSLPPHPIHILTFGPVMRSQELHFQPGEAEAAVICGCTPSATEVGINHETPLCNHASCRGHPPWPVLITLPVICLGSCSVATLASTLFS